MTKIPSDASGPNEVGSASAGFGLVEALIAIVILSVGLLAIAGIALAVGQQTRSAAWTTDQVLAGQQVLGAAVSGSYASLATKDTMIQLGDRSVTVSRTVTQVAPGVKEVDVTVPGVASDVSDFTITTRVHAPRGLPTSGPS